MCSLFVVKRIFLQIWSLNLNNPIVLFDVFKSMSKSLKERSNYNNNIGNFHIQVLREI